MGTRTGFDAPIATTFDFRRAWWERALRFVVYFAVGMIFVRAFVVQPAAIPSRSMEDTLLVGDQILVNRFVYAMGGPPFLPTRPPARGDVVVFRHPRTPEVEFVKRIVALPGETVRVEDGVVVVDGRPLDEPYVNPLYRDRRRHGPERVPVGHYFVMGDRRNASSDSRVWGTVPAEMIDGRAFLVLVSSEPWPGERDEGEVSPVRGLRRSLRLLVRGRWERAFRRIE